MSTKERGKSRSRKQPRELPLPSRFRVTVAIALAIVAGWLTLSQAAGMVYSKYNPSLAIQSASNNGDPYGREAELLLSNAASGSSPSSSEGEGELSDLQLDAEPEIAPEVLTRAQELGRQGFERAPLSVASVRSVAIAADLAGNNETARQIMDPLMKLTKRDSPSHLWMIADLGKRGDLDGVLNQYDMALRTSRRAQAILLPQLAAGLQYAEFIPPIESILLQSPPWGPQLWRTLYRVPVALPNATELRLRMLARGNDFELDPEVDRRLILSLVRERQWDLAAKLYSTVADDGASRLTGISSDEFRSEPRFQPFDWAFASTGLQSASADVNAGQLVISGSPRGTDAAASRIVALREGVYDFKLAVANSNPESDARVTAAVLCIETSPYSTAARFSSYEGNLRGSFLVGSRCRIHLVQIFAITGPETGFIQEMRLSEISLRRR